MSYCHTVISIASYDISIYQPTQTKRLGLQPYIHMAIAPHSSHTDTESHLHTFTHSQPVSQPETQTLIESHSFTGLHTIQTFNQHHIQVVINNTQSPIDTQSHNHTKPLQVHITIPYNHTMQPHGLTVITQQHTATATETQQRTATTPSHIPGRCGE